MKYDTIIIGAGKFGCVIGRALQELGGHKVLILDAQREMSASKCSGGLIYPPWVNMMDKKAFDNSLAVLSQLYGVEELKLEFQGAKTKVVSAFHVQINRVLQDKKLTIVHEKALGFGPGWVNATSEKRYECKHIVICAGVWSNEFTKIPGLCGKQGVSFVFPGKVPETTLSTLGSQGFIRPWAPYKQIVAHKHDDQSFWAGDGTAILDKNWSPKKEHDAALRVTEGVKRTLSEARVQRGIRPFVSGVTNTKPCYFKRIKHAGKNKHDSVYLATGAGKSGMIASAWCAVELLAKITK